MSTSIETASLQDTIVIYTHPDCGYSAAAKDEFLQSDIPFREIDLGSPLDSIRHRAVFFLKPGFEYGFQPVQPCVTCLDDFSDSHELNSKGLLMGQPVSSLKVFHNQRQWHYLHVT